MRIDFFPIFWYQNLILVKNGDTTLVLQKIKWRSGLWQYKRLYLTPEFVKTTHQLIIWAGLLNLKSYKIMNKVG